MSAEMKSRTAVVLAAGKGTRMKSDLPKVAFPLLDHPMIEHVLENLRLAGIKRIVVVVGYRKEDVTAIVENWKKNFSDLHIEYALQEEQKGTGHALLCTESIVKNMPGCVIVTSGDMPLIQPETFVSLLDEHEKKGNEATVLSAILDHPRGYGRLVRDSSGKLLRITEEKDADEKTKLIREVNSGTYAFNSPDVFRVIKNIGSANAQNEYYLPDVISLYRQEGKEVGSLASSNENECKGANSVDELKELEDLIRSGEIRVRVRA